MNYYSFSAIANFITSILIFFFVSRKTKQSASTSKIYFSLFALAVAEWSLGYFFWQISTSYDQALFYFRFLMVGAIWIPCFFFNFIVELTNQKKNKKFYVITNYIVSLIFSVLNLTPYYIKSLTRKLNFIYWPVPGPAFIYFLGYFLIITVIAHVILWQMITKSSDAKARLQYKYVFAGTLIGFIGGSTNYFLFFDIPVKPIGNVLVLVYVATVAYAIIRHQLLDIEVVVRRAAVFAGLFAFVYGLFTIVTVIGQEFFRSSLGWNQWVSMIPTVLIITFTLRPLENFLTNVTEKFLFQKKI